jgi:predicted nucleotidyltransferase
MVSREAIQNYAQAIAREFQPQRIILFGSYAHGKPTEDSDVDLMVVMPFTGNALEQAFRIRTRVEHPGFPIDLLVRSPKEIAKRVAMGDFFVKEILESGHTLYAGSDS